MFADRALAAVIAARQCGYGVQIFGDPQDSPAGQVSDRAWPSSFTDHDALRQFAKHVDVVTYEQENIPVATVETLLQHVPVLPGPELLRASQHRLLEKTLSRSTTQTDMTERGQQIRRPGLRGDIAA